MSGLTDTNIVLGQGNAIKEVHNVKRQGLDLNQQFVAQKAEDKKEKEKSKVQNFEGGDRIEINSDEEKGRENDPRYNKKNSEKEKSTKVPDSEETRLIDIKV